VISTDKMGEGDFCQKKEEVVPIKKKRKRKLSGS